MSAPNKAAAYRAGYRRALRDVDAEVDRVMEALSLVIDCAPGADAQKLGTLRSFTIKVRDRAVFRLKREIEES